MERIIHLNDGPEQSGELIVEYNIETGRAYSEGMGFWSALFADWKEAVQTSLMRIQMKRMLDSDFYQFFVSKSAAEFWIDGRSQARL